MKLTFLERVTLLEMLPQESGSLAERRIIRGIQKVITPTEEELKEIGYDVQVQDDGSTYATWNHNKTKGIELVVTDEMIPLFKELIKQAEEDKKINDRNFDLLDKFDKL